MRPNAYLPDWWFPQWTEVDGVPDLFRLEYEIPPDKVDPEIAAGYAWMRLGTFADRDPARGLPRLERAMDRAARRGDASSAHKLADLFVMLSLQRGRYHARAEKLARELVDEKPDHLHLRNLAMVLLVRGKWREAGQVRWRSRGAPDEHPHPEFGTPESKATDEAILRQFEAKRDQWARSIEEALWVYAAAKVDGNALPGCVTALAQALEEIAEKRDAFPAEAAQAHAVRTGWPDWWPETWPKLDERPLLRRVVVGHAVGDPGSEAALYESYVSPILRADADPKPGMPALARMISASLHPKRGAAERLLEHHLVLSAIRFGRWLGTAERFARCHAALWRDALHFTTLAEVLERRGKVEEAAATREWALQMRDDHDDGDQAPAVSSS